MNSDQLQSIVRAALVSVGTAVVAGGYMTNDQWTAAAGAIAVLASVAWSMYFHKEDKPK